MKKKLPQASGFFSIFVGELMALTLKLKLTGQEASDDGSVSMSEEPLQIMGYLLEEDENYYFLGEDPRQATVAVKKDEVMFAMVVQPADIEDSVLDGIPNKPKGEWN